LCIKKAGTQVPAFYNSQYRILWSKSLRNRSSTITAPIRITVNISITQ
jgi:hypothetical protein